MEPVERQGYLGNLRHDSPKIANSLWPGPQRCKSLSSGCGAGLRPAMQLAARAFFRNALMLLVLAVSVRAEDQATRVYLEGQKA